MDLRKHKILTRLLTVLLSILAPMTRVVAQNSGKVGAVNADATGTPPGEAGHTLVVGAGVVYKESIKTSAQGSTQILFPDQSTLNVGRNSTIVIDEYVYDPKAGTGTMLASLTKGTLRFVGGQISHTSGATVTTPAAVLGIRGGVATIAFPITPQLRAADPDLAGCSGELVIGHVGSLTLKNKVSEVTIRPGFATCVSGPNVPIMAPFRISDLLLANIVATLRSAPGQSGGASTPPAGPFISANDIGTAILNNPAHPPGADPLGLTSIFSFGSSVARSKSQTMQLKNTAPPAPPPPPPPPYGAR